MKARTLADAAAFYAELGYRVFPCVPGEKRPLTPHGCLDATANMEQVEAWWIQWPTANIGLVTDGLLVVDIDGADNPWPGAERQLDLARGPVARTPRGGTHHYHRQPGGNVQPGVQSEGCARVGAGWRNTASSLAPLVDTRANGGYVLAPPSVVGGVAYSWVETLELESGPESLPEPCPWLREALESAGSNGGRAGERDATAGQGNAIAEGGRNAALARLGGVMRRAGFGLAEIQAALDVANRERCKPPLPAGEVRKVAASVARYEPDQVTVAVVEGHYEADRLAAGHEAKAAGGRLEDPGVLPVELLRCPGFVSELLDHTMETAPYPNQAMSFAGALALLATLAGRKYRDEGDNRTNLYLLGLAHSSAGKDKPRKVNAEILSALNIPSWCGGAFASGEGLQDSLFVTPTMLFQTDEIDGMLQSINKSMDARHEGIMGTLLTMYSAANSVFPMRRKAKDAKDKSEPGVIHAPCLVLFGTAVPTHYYKALSERMLTNGFFARMIVIESGRRGSGQEPCIRPIPSDVMEAGAWMRDFVGEPGGNLSAMNPVAHIVAADAGARALLVESRLEAEAEYDKAEERQDTVGTTVWGRVSENIRKLALLHAISASHQFPYITADGVAWARTLVFHQVRRMLFMAAQHVAENPFHAECLKATASLRASGGRLSHSALLKKSKLDAKKFMELIQTLQQRGEVREVREATGGRTAVFYELA